MRSSTPLLCELHAHTTWSDGALSVRELVDLYGGAGFDVLAVTDHVVRPDYAHVSAVSAAKYESYLDELDAEGERALARYGLLVIPGLELTYDHPDPRLGAHALALGIRRFVGLEQGLDVALADAAGAGAALIGAHPYTLAGTQTSPRTTARFAEEPDWAAGRRYVRIVGVALSDWTRENGGLIVKTEQGPEPVELAAGDAVMMDPDLEHSGGVNRTGAIRYGVYFRFLEDG